MSVHIDKVQIIVIHNTLKLCFLGRRDNFLRLSQDDLDYGLLNIHVMNMYQYDNNNNNNNNNNKNNNNNNNGNFICVFECTIVNLATYRQFINAA